MKRSLLAVGLLGCAFVGLWYGAGGATPVPVAANESALVATPLTHENLAVYFIYGPDTVPNAKVMSLQEALERDLAVVHETSNVNVLAVENTSSEYELFIQSGDIVKGGKQDRMAQTDMLLPPKSGVVALPAHCVEQGRWTGRGTEDARRFSSSEKYAAGKELKYANASGAQSAVWQNVKVNQDKLNETLKANVNAGASPTSFQLTLEAPELLAKVAGYEAALKGAGETRAGAVGVVFVVNGQVTGAEVYGSGALFRKAWPKLLNAAAVEAVAERTDGPTAAPPSARDIEHYLAYAATAEPDAGGSGAGAGALHSPDRSNRRGVQINDREAVFLGVLNDDVGLPNIDFALPDVQRVQVQTADVQRAMNTAPVAASFANVNPTNPAVDGSIMGGSGRAAAQPRPQPGAAGNRLSSNRVENSSTLVVESRDPTRANAVIHRSYIKK